MLYILEGSETLHNKPTVLLLIETTIGLWDRLSRVGLDLFYFLAGNIQIFLQVHNNMIRNGEYPLLEKKDYYMILVYSFLP